jgi:hypothetical protein
LSIGLIEREVEQPLWTLSNNSAETHSDVFNAPLLKLRKRIHGTASARARLAATNAGA